MKNILYEIGMEEIKLSLFADALMYLYLLIKNIVGIVEAETPVLWPPEAKS